MFFKKKCLHNWHYIDQEVDPMHHDSGIIAPTLVWIWCSKCRKEKRITDKEWYRINKQQEILRRIEHKETYCPHLVEWDECPDCRH